MYKQVFIIDDDEVSLFLTEATLEMAAFAGQYRTFRCAEEALEEIKNSARGSAATPLPDLVFLDLNMPRMSGWDLLEALVPFEEQLLGTCRFYILTSSVDAQESQRADKYKLVDGFLHKPLEEDTIQNIKKQA